MTGSRWPKSRSHGLRPDSSVNSRTAVSYGRSLCDSSRAPPKSSQRPVCLDLPRMTPRLQTTKTLAPVKAVGGGDGDASPSGSGFDGCGGVNRCNHSVSFVGHVWNIGIVTPRPPRQHTVPPSNPHAPRPTVLSAGSGVRTRIRSPCTE